MTPAEALILSKHRAGQTITPADVCATIRTLVELEEYSIGLKRLGAMTGDAMKAIAVRRHELRAPGSRG